MTFHQLKIFETVAEHLNITTASRKIRISQPSVSKQLRLLEKECGLKLYVRCRQGIRVTEEGRLFQIAAKPIIEQMEKLETHICQSSRRHKSQTPHGGQHTQSGGIFPFRGTEILCGTPSQRPSHAANRVPSAMEEMVLKGEVEIALTTILPHHPQIIAEPIHVEGLLPSFPLNTRWLRKKDSMKLS